MKKVEMLVSTAYMGPRKEGDIIEVPDDFAARWCKNGIAKLVEELEDTEDDETVEDAAEDTEEAVDYSKMSAKELFAACKEKGIEVDAKKSKEYYIEKLTSH